MGQPFIGEIRMFGGNFAPSGWAFCNGALIPISENDALFTLIGTTYGGDGESTFALPNLSSRYPIHQGTSPATGTSYILGQTGGTEEVTVTTNQIPIHSHVALANSNSGNSGSPTNSVWAQASIPLYTSAAADVNMAVGSAGPVGGSQPHENMMPFLCVSFIISLFGIFPQQS